MTHSPRPSAGLMRFSTWSPRAAANSTASATWPSDFAAPDSTTWRTISAPGDPPGSRVRTTSMPKLSSRRASVAAWVDFPAPSPPSKVMKRPAKVLPSLFCRPSDLYLLCPHSEQPDDELGGGVERALPEVAALDALGGIER